MSDYWRPTTLSEALECRRAGARVLAGGTDFYPALVDRPLRPAGGPAAILDISKVGELRGISTLPDGSIRIGAATTWTEIAEARLNAGLGCLAEAACEVGGRQIQNRGTIAGNIVNASPAADGIPALLALDAEVEIAAPDARLRLPLDRFILGPRRTALRSDEILVAVVLRRPGQTARSTFLKLGTRRYLVISIAMAAGFIETDGEQISAARIAVGSCSPVAQRLSALEAELIGQPIAPAIGSLVEPRHLAPLTPIGDARASADYRRSAALVLVRRLLERLGATR